MVAKYHLQAFSISPSSTDADTNENGRKGRMRSVGRIFDLPQKGLGIEDLQPSPFYNM